MKRGIGNDDFHEKDELCLTVDVDKHCSMDRNKEDELPPSGDIQINSCWITKKYKKMIKRSC